MCRLGQDIKLAALQRRPTDGRLTFFIDWNTVIEAHEHFFAGRVEAIVASYGPAGAPQVQQALRGRRAQIMFAVYPNLGGAEQI